MKEIKKLIRKLIKRIRQIRNTLIKRSQPHFSSLAVIASKKSSIFNVRYDVMGKNNFLYISDGASLKDALIYIRGNNHKIVLGNCAHFRKGELWIEDEGGSIYIGEFSTVEDAHFAVTEPGRSIVVGKDCMISKSVEIRTGDSHSIIYIQSGERINNGGNVVLEDHVWLGAHTKVMKGVSIGMNSIIGTSAVVTKSIPPNTLATGIPAKPRKTGVTWLRQRI